jgi:hypothetical protein
MKERFVNVDGVVIVFLESLAEMLGLAFAEVEQ